MSQSPRISVERASKGRMAAYHVALEVFRLAPSTKGITIAMIVIGIAAGLAEAIGITFLVSLVSLLYLGDGSSGPVGGWMPGFLHFRGMAISNTLIVSILIVAFLTQLLLTLANASIGSHVMHKMSESVRRRLHDQMLDLAFEDVSQRDRGELITILATESYLVSQAHAAIVRIGVNLGTLAIFGLALFGTAWQLALVAFAAGLLHTLCMKLFSRSFRKVGRNLSESLEELTRLSWGILQARKSIRTFGAEPRKRRDFQTYSNEVMASMTRSNNLGHVTSMLSQLLIFIIVLVVIWLAMWLKLPFPTVMAATVLLYRMQPHIREFDWSLLRLIEAETPIGRIAALLDPSDKIYIKTGISTIDRVDREIRFENVTYRYPGVDRDSIREVSFPIEARRNTAILGPSGVGKTTVLNLLLRLAVPTSGKLLVDGIDLTEIGRESWAGVISVAGQDVELIEGTIRENITFFRDFSDEDVRWAAELAGVNEFIGDMKHGYDEWVGDEALQLSGGQRQRLGLARALIGRPNVLLLDEATSALDEELEELVLANVLKTFHDRTVIVITHRRRISDMFECVVTLSRAGATVTRTAPATA